MMSQANSPLHAMSLPYPFVCEVRHLPIKRVFDIVFSLCALTFGLPLFFAIAAAIKLTSRGRAVYSHERIGRGGKPFHCYKFRTMYSDADMRLKELLAHD